MGHLLTDEFGSKDTLGHKTRYFDASCMTPTGGKLTKRLPTLMTVRPTKLRLQDAPTTMA